MAPAAGQLPSKRSPRPSWGASSSKRASVWTPRPSTRVPPALPPSTGGTNSTCSRAPRSGGFSFDDPDDHEFSDEGMDWDLCAQQIDLDDEFSDEGIDWDLCAQQITPLIQAQQRHAARPSKLDSAPTGLTSSSCRPMGQARLEDTVLSGRPKRASGTSQQTCTPSPAHPPSPTPRSAPETVPTSIRTGTARARASPEWKSDGTPQPIKCTCPCVCGAREYNRAMGLEPPSPPWIEPHKPELSRSPKCAFRADGWDTPAQPQEGAPSRLVRKDTDETAGRRSVTSPYVEDNGLDTVLSPPGPGGHLMDASKKPEDPIQAAGPPAEHGEAQPPQRSSGSPAPVSHKPKDSDSHAGDVLVHAAGLERPGQAPNHVEGQEPSTLTLNRQEEQQDSKPALGHDRSAKHPDQVKERPIRAPVKTPDQLLPALGINEEDSCPPAVPILRDDNPSLSPQQQEILDMVVHGEQSLLFTGGAGTGKSVLVRALVQQLRKKYEDWGYGKRAVGVCALTGVAALHIGGQTLHSWAGVGLGNLPVEHPPGAKARDSLYGIVSRNKTARRTWMHTQVLIVDEVSMLDAILFDKLEHLARLMRDSDAPFGGMQLVLVGDFFQLPPVVTNPTFFGPKDQAKVLKLQYQELCASYPSRFVFDAKSWARCIPQVVFLRKVFRQADMEFVRMLEEARRGRLSRQSIQKFRALARPLARDGIVPTELYPLREQVERANLSRLKALQEESHFFHAIDQSFVHRKRKGQSEGDFQKQVKVFLDKYVTAAPQVELKVGAQVMLLKNLSNGLVNGSLGIIEGFKVISKGRVALTDDGSAIFVDPSELLPDQDDNQSSSPVSPSEARSRRRIYPGRGRYSHGDILISRPAEGIDDAKSPEADRTMDSSQGMPDSQASFIALSPSGGSPDGARCTAWIDTRGTHGSSVGGDVNLGIEIAVPSVSRKGMQKIDTVGPSLEHIEPDKAYPLVRFSSGKKVILPCLPFEVQSPVGDKEAVRVQVPLMLAWSMSIHKAQGQTLEKSKVDFSRIFERGQAYVALSRSTSLEGLQVLGFDPESVKAHDRVLEWEREFAPPTTADPS